MGLTDEQAARLHAAMRPIVSTPTAELVTEDATIGNEERLRGIPAVGRVSGTMKGTRPGDGLEDEGHAILKQRMKNARRKLGPTC